jgi:hypothetical protein
MASCPGTKIKKNWPCLTVLYRCKRCNNVGCDQAQVGECSNQGFRLGKCLRCGAQSQKDLFR